MMAAMAWSTDRLPRSMRALLLLALWCWSFGARADELQDRFNTVWESVWYQGGAPSSVARWQDDIRVVVRGTDVSMHRERILAALKTVADHAGRRVIDVSGSADGVSQAGLDVEIVDNHRLEDNQPCYVRLMDVSQGVIRKAELKMRSRLVYHCVLHEAMHAMGIPGHPSGSTVLSYFYQRVDALTELDTLMLKAWYSPQMRPGMTPLEAVGVLTGAVADAAGAPEDARERRQRFMQETFASMEAYASDKGEIPVVLKRSGKASAESMRRGQTLMRFFLGMAYLRGQNLARDPARAADWFERAARDGLPAGQMVMGTLFEYGEGVLASQEDAYVWYSLAAAQDVGQGRSAVERLAPGLTPEQLERAKARIRAFK